MNYENIMITFLTVLLEHVEQSKKCKLWWQDLVVAMVDLWEMVVKEVTNFNHACIFVIWELIVDARQQVLLQVSDRSNALTAVQQVLL